MNFKLLGCIAMGVFVAHLAVFMMVFRVRSTSGPTAPLPEPANLRVAEEVVIDPRTKTKLVNREITVSTKLRSEVYTHRPEEAVKR